MKRLTIIGLWPDDVVKYCTEKCDCRRYAFDRILYHRGGRDARERICIPVVDRSGAVTTYLDLPVLFLEANAVYLHLDDGSDIFLSNTQMLLIANEVVGVMPVISARNAGKGRLCQRIPLKERALKFVKEAIKNGRKKAH